MKCGLAVAASCLVLGLLAVPIGAQADTITLGSNPTTGTVSFTGNGPVPGTITVSSTTITGNATFDALTGGTFALSPLASFTTLPENLSGNFTAPAGVTDGLTITFTGGSSLSGTLTIGGITDGSNTPRFNGTLLVTAATGAFTGQAGQDLAVDFTVALGTPTGPAINNALCNIQSGTTHFAECLTAISQVVGSQDTATFSSGEVILNAIPAPIVGAGLPGLVAACAGLLALGRRRRQKIATA